MATLADSDACRDCVTLVEVARLTSSDPRGQALFPSALARRAGGGYWLGPTMVRGTVAAFDSGGTLVGSLGRYGEGPGEMRDVLSVDPWWGDSIVVFHDHNVASVFDAGGAYSRTIRFQSTSFILRRVEIAGPGRLLAVRNGTMGGADTPLRAFDVTGAPGVGYGESTSFGQGEARSYAVVRAAGDTILAANRFTWEIDLFSGDEDMPRATFRREPDWFRLDAQPTAWGGRPMIEDMSPPSKGRVWVLLSRPRPDYVFTPRGPRGEVEEAAPVQQGTGDVAAYKEFVLELIDLAGRTVVASHVVRGQVLSGFVDHDHLYGYEEDPETGALTVVIWRLT